ncbi:MAG: hypothetical protein JWM20_977 [Patescibacteria group bacterium]|nr:hypothetical protein [Patescibacteria group bacterium]
MSRNTKLYVPKDYARIKPELPVIFIGAPVVNANDRQSDAIKIFLERNASAAIVSPREKVIPLFEIQSEKTAGAKYRFEKKSEWERFYVNLALNQSKGCVMFWLEGPKICNIDLPMSDLPGPEDPNKPYAFMTQFHLGHVLAKKASRVVIGSDGTYPEWASLKSRILDLHPTMKIYPTLEEACDAALEKIK